MARQHGPQQKVKEDDIHNSSDISVRLLRQEERNYTGLLTHDQHRLVNKCNNCCPGLQTEVSK